MVLTASATSERERDGGDEPASLRNQLPQLTRLASAERSRQCRTARDLGLKSLAAQYFRQRTLQVSLECCS